MSFMAHEAAGLAPSALESARWRTRWILFAGVALGSTGYIAAATVAAIAGEALLGDPALAGAPSAAVVLGAAVGAVVLSWLMSRRGRRIGLTSGFLAGVAGALVATAAVVIGSFPLLIVGSFVIGFGNSSGNLSRYAAADIVSPDRRAVAIGLVVWASTIGGVVGPLLVPFAGSLAVAAGLPSLAGPYLVPVVVVGIAAILLFTLLRPDPFALAHESAIQAPTDAPQVPVRDILLRPAVLGAFAALVAGQATMVLIMTMTPLHLTHHGHGLDIVGAVISAHVFGMFALAPISGFITQRIGQIPTILVGTAVLILASVLAAVAPTDNAALLFIALFLLGWGWNLGFVAGSALLASGVEVAGRARVQGVADAVIWTTSAMASLGSGAVVAAAGFSTLGILGAAVVVAPIWLLLRGRRALASAISPTGGA
ncbi:MAG TPA: MFS transporter [Candidatus Binatia bacterium]|nr:MFS transporter [Candidatus Binatia bacterium]